MAIQEQLAILKKGVKVWNSWRDENPNVKIDLSGYNLANQSLERINFSSAILSNKTLNHSNFSHSKFENSDLRYSRLMHTNFFGSVLRAANLSNGNLNYTNFTRANLCECILKSAFLSHVNFDETDLRSTDFSFAIISQSLFVNVDLSESIGLDTCTHKGPSSIDQNTIIKSGFLSTRFLKGIGLRDWEIEETRLYNTSLSNAEINDVIYRIYDLRATQSIQIAPMFISYSHEDKAFVDKIGELLTEKGVRYWRDIHDMKAGNMEKQVDRAIRLNDLVLIVLSENSVKSDWVELEVNKARKMEKEHDKDVLCPIALDDSWKDVKWSESIQLQLRKNNILDFSDWQNEEVLKKKFADLITGIDLFYE